MLVLSGCGGEEPEFKPTPSSTTSPAPPQPASAPTSPPPTASRRLQLAGGPRDGNRPHEGCTCCDSFSTSWLCKFNQCGNRDGAAQKWCYVEHDVCADQWIGNKPFPFHGVQWSYLACDHEQDPTYIAIETGNCRGQGYDPILDDRECTHAYVMGAQGFHHNFEVAREVNPNRPEGCYFDSSSWAQAEATRSKLDLHLNTDPRAAGRGAAQGIGEDSVYLQLCKSSR